MLSRVKLFECMSIWLTRDMRDALMPYGTCRRGTEKNVKKIFYERSISLVLESQVWFEYFVNLAKNEFEILLNPLYSHPNQN